LARLFPVDLLALLAGVVSFVVVVFLRAGTAQTPHSLHFGMRNSECGMEIQNRNPLSNHPQFFILGLRSAFRIPNSGLEEFRIGRIPNWVGFREDGCYTPANPYNRRSGRCSKPHHP
jgi:hypothetical protein